MTNQSKTSPSAAAPRRRVSKVILHIGSHKTGSTFLQNYAYDNHEALLGHGVYYPQLADAAEVQQHSALALLLRAENKQPAVEALERLAAEAAGVDADTLLVSGEEFFFATDDEVTLLRDTLRRRLDCRFRVLIYIRNTYDYVRSVLNQHLRFESHPLSERELVGFLDVYRPTEIIRRWEAAFGADAVEVYSYDQHRPRLLDHFLDLLGVPRLGDPSTIRKLDTNPSIDFLTAFVLNQLLFDKSARLKHQIYSEIVTKTDSRDDLHYGSQIAMIRSAVHRLQLDLTHPKLVPLGPYITRVPDRSQSMGHEKETIWRLLQALDLLLTKLETAGASALSEEEEEAARKAEEAVAAEVLAALEAEAALETASTSRD